MTEFALPFLIAVVYLIAAGLCDSAARGDRQLEQARQRDQVGSVYRPVSDRHWRDR